MIDIDKEPQRYALLAGAIGPTVSGGDWVKYEDYAALIAEVRAFREEAVAHQAFVGSFNARYGGVAHMHERWISALAQAAPYKQAAIDAARAKEKS